jgi:hypothetical protein
MLALTAALILGQTPSASADWIRFPNDPSVVDAKRDLGAKGDGITDDTDALQKGLDLTTGIGGGAHRVLYLPVGTYRITRTLVVNSALGPWLYGASRRRTVIRLADGRTGVTAAIRTHPRDGGDTSADWFMRNIRNLTIDVGNNPEVDGIRWAATNTGILKNVTVRGNGKIGIHTGFIGQTGPNLIQNVTVDGFQTGIASNWAWGQTLSDVQILNAKRRGLSVVANVIGAEGLTVRNTPEPIVLEIPNDWYWWGGVLAIVNSNLQGSDPSQPAIRNQSVLYARNVTTSGVSRSIESNSPKGSVDAAKVGEYTSHDARSSFPSPGASLGLPILRTPEVPWENNPSKWLCADDYGVIAGDGKDDTAAFQKAFDAAAKLKKTVVYIRGVVGREPNWMNLAGRVRVKAPVRHVLGLGWARILNDGNGSFVVDDQSAPLVRFAHIDAFGGPPVSIINRSQKNTLIVESCGVAVVGEGRGNIFLNDVPGDIHLRSKGQSAWARHYNPEGTQPEGLVRNAGGNLWALGVKSEGGGVKFKTTDGGSTEVLGMFMYGPGLDDNYPHPMFDTVNSRLSVAGLRELCFTKATYAIKGREVRGSETKTITTVPGEHGWIGWALYSAYPARN